MFKTRLYDTTSDDGIGHGVMDFQVMGFRGAVIEINSWASGDIRHAYHFPSAVAADFHPCP